jgi:hypothetical protein
LEGTREGVGVGVGNVGVLVGFDGANVHDVATTEEGK